MQKYLTLQNMISNKISLYTFTKINIFNPIPGRLFYIPFLVGVGKFIHPTLNPQKSSISRTGFFPAPRSAFFIKIGTESLKKRIDRSDKNEKSRHRLDEILQNSLRVSVTNS